MFTTPSRIISSIVYFLSILIFIVHSEEEPWSFIVLADWHNAEPFAIYARNATSWDALYEQIHYMKETYGGDLVLLPGDSNNGKWDTEEFAQKFNWNFGVRKRILEAGRNCYGTMRELFTTAGYDQILIAVGDHELGGNKWIPGSTKVDSLHKYRQGFAEEFNEEPTTGLFRFRILVQRPPGQLTHHFNKLHTPINTRTYYLLLWMHF